MSEAVSIAPTYDQGDAERTPLVLLMQAGIWLAVGALSLVIGLGPHRALYIADNFVWIATVSGVVAVAAGLYQLAAALLAMRGSHFNFRVGPMLILLIFLVPLVLTVAVKPKPFGVRNLQRSGFAMGAGDSSSDDSGPKLTGPTITIDEAYKQAEAAGTWTPSIVEILDGLNKRMDQTVAQPVATLGFVYREKDMPPNKFGLLRYATVHCTAEARPVGIWVETADAAKYGNDTWVWVSGKVEISELEGKQIAQINADQIQFTEEPAGPYIFYSPAQR